MITCVAVPALAAATAAGWVIASNTPASHVAGNIWCWSSPQGGGSVQMLATGQAPAAGRAGAGGGGPPHRSA